jgi:transcriptional regulator GlxA family with amidase domain
MELSLKQFNRRFKSATGETVIKRIHQVRVETAMSEQKYHEIPEES